MLLSCQETFPNGSGDFLSVEEYYGYYSNPIPANVLRLAGRNKKEPLRLDNRFYRSLAIPMMPGSHE